MNMTRSASPRRRHPRRALLAAALLASLWLPGTLLARSAPAAPLQAEAQRLASLLPGGELGAAIVHLESGRSVYINGDRPFPMASTMKVPVAVHILKLVDEGTLSLQQQVQKYLGWMRAGWA